jgi:hypothetical protein
MRKSILVMEFRGKGRQMENTGRTEPAGVRQEASAGVREETRWESSDVYCDVSTVLRLRRWEQREGPFRGFDSPEGKF